MDDQVLDLCSSDGDDVPLAQGTLQPSPQPPPPNAAPPPRSSSSRSASDPPGPSAAPSGRVVDLDLSLSTSDEDEPLSRRSAPDGPSDAEDDEMNLGAAPPRPAPSRRRRRSSTGTSDRSSGSGPRSAASSEEPAPVGKARRPKRRAAIKPEGAYALKKRMNKRNKAARGRPSTDKRRKRRRATGDGSPEDEGVEVDDDLREADVERVRRDPWVPCDAPCTAEARAAWLAKQSQLKPSARCIVGPSCERELECELMQVLVWKELDSLSRNPPELIDKSRYDSLFEQMVNDVNREEIGDISKSRIRVVPQVGNPNRSPNFEFYYTNRVIYPPNLLPVLPPGCGCVGNCADPRNIDTCACRKRQELVCTTREGSLNIRSGWKGFAYDEEGVISSAMLDSGEPVIECNSSCGCGPECLNRVVGKKASVAVDLYHTNNAGWAVRNPHSYPADPERGITTAYVERTIRRGTPLAIYSGEFISVKESISRHDSYDEIRRNYLFNVDPWTAAEELGFFDKDEQQDANLSEEAKDLMSAAFVVDAFLCGNWTRFCNHKCVTFNATARPVVVDDDDPRRPLWVFFALEDIAPGDEITIAYHDRAAGYDETAFNKQKREEWRKDARDRRRDAAEHHRCRCGDKYCWGLIFELATDVIDSDDELELDKPVPDGVKAQLEAVGATAQPIVAR